MKGFACAIFFLSFSDARDQTLWQTRCPGLWSDIRVAEISPVPPSDQEFSTAAIGALAT